MESSSDSELEFDGASTEYDEMNVTKDSAKEPQSQELPQSKSMEPKGRSAEDPRQRSISLPGSSTNGPGEKECLRPKTKSDANYIIDSDEDVDYEKSTDATNQGSSSTYDITHKRAETDRADNSKPTSHLIEQIKRELQKKDMLKSDFKCSDPLMLNFQRFALNRRIVAMKLAGEWPISHDEGKENNPDDRGGETDKNIEPKIAKTDKDAREKSESKSQFHYWWTDDMETLLRLLYDEEKKNNPDDREDETDKNIEPEFVKADVGKDTPIALEEKESELNRVEATNEIRAKSQVHDVLPEVTAALKDRSSDHRQRSINLQSPSTNGPEEKECSRPKTNSDANYISHSVEDMDREKSTDAPNQGSSSTYDVTQLSGAETDRADNPEPKKLGRRIEAIKPQLEKKKEYKKPTGDSVLRNSKRVSSKFKANLEIIEKLSGGRSHSHDEDKIKENNPNDKEVKTDKNIESKIVKADMGKDTPIAMEEEESDLNRVVGTSEINEQVKSHVHDVLPEGTATSKKSDEMSTATLENVVKHRVKGPQGRRLPQRKSVMLADEDEDTENNPGERETRTDKNSESQTSKADMEKGMPSALEEMDTDLNQVEATSEKSEEIKSKVHDVIPEIPINLKDEDEENSLNKREDKADKNVTFLSVKADMTKDTLRILNEKVSDLISRIEVSNEKSEQVILQVGEILLEITIKLKETEKS